MCGAHTYTHHTRAHTPHTRVRTHTTHARAHTHTHTPQTHTHTEVDLYQKTLILQEKLLFCKKFQRTVLNTGLIIIHIILQYSQYPQVLAWVFTLQ